MNYLLINFKKYWLTVCMLCLPFASVAQECKNQPSVNLQAVSSKQVSNDMVQLSWRLEIEKPDSGMAMLNVNESLKKVLSRLEKKAQVRNVVTNVQTYPVYDSKSREIQHWRGQGTLSFEISLNALKQLSRLETDAAPMVLASLRYFVSDALKEVSRAELLDLAMNEFKNKARLAAKGFDYQDYVLAQLSINDEANDLGPQPNHYRQESIMRMAAPAQTEQTSLPASGGESEMSVSIQGNVCLKP